MKHSLRPAMLFLGLLCIALAGAVAWAQQTDATKEAQPAAPATTEPVEQEAAATTQAVEADSDEAQSRGQFRRHRYSGDDVVVNLWDDAHLAADEIADGVIAIFGDARVEGEVNEAVVAVFGNAHVTGTVDGGVVSLFGNTYIDGPVREAAVSVFGDLELGPHAEIDGDAVAIGGKLTRDPQAQVHGHTQVVGSGLGGMQWLRTWIEKCLLYGRPLAFESELGWAWGIALGFLLFYVVIALLFDRSVAKCVETLETQPGQSVVTSIMTVLLVPVLVLLLILSVIGIAMLPFVGMALFCAGLFGKAVMLAALGRRVTRFTGIGPFSHVAFATLVGGILVLGLYVIPVVGFITYKLLGILGLGVVTYTLLLAMRQRNASRSPRPPATATATAATASISPVAPAVATELPQSDEPPAPPPAATTVAQAAAPRAGFWIRMAALLIDLVLVCVIVAMLDTPEEIGLIALAAYGAVMWKLKGTTIGGIVCGLKVVRRDGGEINWDTAIVRALSCFLSLIVAGLGFLWIVFDEEGQAWHDKIAGTLVVRSPKPESLV
jgi:uncharacterized RDD family membrane protein YckC